MGSTVGQVFSTARTALNSSCRLKTWLISLLVSAPAIAKLYSSNKRYASATAWSASINRAIVYPPIPLINGHMEMTVRCAAAALSTSDLCQASI